MRKNYRNSIASIKKFPQFTTMNVIDGQAGLIICASLIFYSLTIDNILNIIVLLILAGVSIAMLTGDNSLLGNAQKTGPINNIGAAKDEIGLAYNTAMQEYYEEKYAKGNNVDFASKFNTAISPFIAEGADTSNSKNHGCKVEYDESDGTITITNGGYKVIGKVDTDGSAGISWGEMNETRGSNWEYDHATQTVKKGNLELKIGDYVNTTPYTVDGKQFDGKWRVLGEENGQLLLVSANYVDFQGSTGSEGTPLIQLQGSNGIDNEVGRLNTLSAKFADGTKTEKGRSIKVEDINKITGYEPTDTRLNANDLTQKGLYGMDYFGPDEGYAKSLGYYGGNVTYTIKAGVQNSGKNAVWFRMDQETSYFESNYTTFIPYGESSDITSPFTIKSTFYRYFPETLGDFPRFSSSKRSNNGRNINQ